MLIKNHPLLDSFYHRTYVSFEFSWSSKKYQLTFSKLLAISMKCKWSESMRRSIALSLLIVVSPLMLYGCSYDRFASMTEQKKGVLVSPAQFSSFTPDQTASRDVEATLGQPSRVQKKGGRELWVYSCERFNSNPLIAPQNSFHAVFFEFNSKGILVKKWRKDVFPGKDD